MKQTNYLILILTFFLLVNSNIDSFAQTGQTINTCSFKPNDVPVKDVNMYENHFTGIDGCIQIQNVSEGTVIKPTKQSDWLDGVSILDIYLMRQAILGQITLTPYQKIAADINKNGFISTLDMVILQKIILQKNFTSINELPPSWVFVDEKYQFPNPDTTLLISQDYPDSIIVSSSESDYSFKAIKMGDLNYNLESLDSFANKELTIYKQPFSAGETVKANLQLKNVNIFNGFEYNLNFDTTKLKVKSIRCNSLPNFSISTYSNIKDNKIIISYNSPNPITPTLKKVIVNIEFEALSNGLLSESLKLDTNRKSFLVAEKNYSLNATWSTFISGTSACAFRPNDVPEQDVKMYENHYTGSDGCVNISDLNDGTILEPSKKDNWLNGVTTLDMVLMKKAILGQITLTPYQVVAADISGNGTVSTLDEYLLYKIITGQLDSAFLANSNVLNEMPPSWVFVDATYLFPIDSTYLTYPLDYPNSITISPNTPEYNFVAIKMGDLNYTAETQTTIQGNTLNIEDKIFNTNETIVSEINIIDVESIEGVEIHFDFDASKFEVKDIKCNALPTFSKEKNCIISEGKILISYIAPDEYIKKGGVEMKDKKINFEIELKATSTGKLSENFGLNNDKMSILIADKNYRLDLKWKNSELSSKNIQNDLNIYIYPQPAKSYLNISLNNTQNSDIFYTIYDSFGKVIRKDILQSNKINVSTINKGLYFIHFQNEEGIHSVKKVVIQK